MQKKNDGETLREVIETLLDSQEVQIGINSEVILALDDLQRTVDELMAQLEELRKMDSAFINTYNSNKGDLQ